MHWIDWTIIGVSIGIVLLIAVFSRRYTKSVADFLTANRCAGRYLLTAAEMAGALAIVSFIAQWPTCFLGVHSRPCRAH